MSLDKIRSEEVIVNSELLFTFRFYLLLSCPLLLAPKQFPFSLLLAPTQ